MNQLIFLTAFLGLTLGTQTVRLDVKGDVAAVELQLDGHSVATLHRAPWQANVDFGTSLVPHRLVAIGRDGSGTELVRAEQKINLPRPNAEAALVVDGQRVRIHWSSIDGKPPKSAELKADGKRIALDANLAGQLPALSSDVPHLLQATIESASGETAETTAIFGGMADSQSGAITAVPVVLNGNAPRDARALEGFFAGATAIGIEKPAADVILVRDPSEADGVMRLGRPLSGGNDAPPSSSASGNIYSRGAPLPPSRSTSSSDSWISRDGTVRFLWPYAGRAASGTPTDLFPSSRRFDRSNGGFHWLLSSVASPVTSPQLRYSDAVAVAGLQALGRQHPRAVVLIVGPSFRDSSTLTAAQVRTFLDSVGVPLFVWSFADAASQPAGTKEWGPV
ncbi:MAG TPA: hypothetical protein VH087_20135, partial [Thermoanaerobaculia bacterium]|nr:hypothetical protein [Thermoanaerobaculia bacterium]